MRRREEAPQRAFREGTGRKKTQGDATAAAVGPCVEHGEQDYPRFPVSRARAAARAQRTPFRGGTGAGAATRARRLRSCPAAQAPAAPPAGHSPHGA